jgi:hypothetical protein
MLALDDAALARLCIGATAVRQRRHRQWLKGVCYLGKPVNGSYLSGHLEAFARPAYRP